jgi:Na+/H+-translocating membrane pyrophosphatase
MNQLLPLIPVVGLAGLLAAVGVYWLIVRQPAGSPATQAIGRRIQEGSAAFLRRQYLVLLPVLTVVA